MTNYVVPQEVKDIKDPLKLLAPLDKFSVAIGFISLASGVAFLTISIVSTPYPEIAVFVSVLSSLAILVGAVAGIAYPLAARASKKKHKAKLDKASKKLQAHLKNEQNLTVSLADCRNLLLGESLVLPAEKGITKHLTLDKESSVFKTVTATYTVTEETFGGHREAIESTHVKAEPTKVLPDKLFAPASK
jgi:4-hydroxy-3-methylbut-2-en-1-yl diphosphate synthase IspG/GcpE